jgi:hypothetical protein
LHCAAIAALRILPAARDAAARVVAADDPAVALEIDLEPPAEGDDTGKAAGAERAPPAAAAALSATREEPRPGVAPRAPAEGATEGEMGAEPAGTVASANVQLVRAPTAELGLGRNAFLAPGSLPESHAPLTNGRPQPIAPDHPPDDARRRVEQALRRPARERERELGLGPEGPVLRALADAASAAATPVTGRAVFVAIANGAGEVVSVDLASCDGGREAWAEAARAALAALAGKKLRVPSSATRAEMRIELTSAWKLPSGHDPGTEVSVMGLPVKKGEGKDSTKMEILNPLPKVVMVPITTDGKDKIPVLVWQLTIFGTNGDPADLAAKPRRIIHSSLLDSKVL